MCRSSWRWIFNDLNNEALTLFCDVILVSNYSNRDQDYIRIEEGIRIQLYLDRGMGYQPRFKSMLELRFKYTDDGAVYGTAIGWIGLDSIGLRCIQSGTEY
jgi:hypothetical protein